MHHTDAQLRECEGQKFRLLLHARLSGSLKGLTNNLTDRLLTRILITYSRHHHKGAATSRRLGTDKAPQLLKVAAPSNRRPNRLATRWECAQLRGCDVGVEELRNRARNRCRRH